MYERKGQKMMAHLVERSSNKANFKGGWTNARLLKCVAGNCGCCGDCFDGILPSTAVKDLHEAETKAALEWESYKGMESAYVQLEEDADEIYSKIAMLDGEGEISKEELVLAHQGEFKMFRDLDVDDSGLISRDEWRNFIKKKSEEASPDGDDPVKGQKWLFEFLKRLQTGLDMEYRRREMGLQKKAMRIALSSKIKHTNQVLKARNKAEEDALAIGQKEVMVKLMGEAEVVWNLLAKQDDKGVKLIQEVHTLRGGGLESSG